MREEAIARSFYRKMEQIQQDGETQGPEAQLPIIYKAISQLFVLATETERLKFADLGTRIAFVGHKYGIPGHALYHVYDFRKNYLRWQRGQKPRQGIPELYDLGRYALCRSVADIFKIPVPERLAAGLPQPSAFRRDAEEIADFLPYLRVVLIRDFPEEECFLAVREDQPGSEVRVRYNITGRNDFFMTTVRFIQHALGFPASMNLLDVEVDKQGVLRPKGFVLLPDYLVDITAISECFTPKAEPLLYLLRKFIPVNPNKYLAIGNIANFFLDELLGGKPHTFKALFGKVFTLNPIGFSTMEDKDILDIQRQCQRHYMHLVDSLQRDFPAQGIEAENSYLEPSFYSREYGIQGRLDLWFRDEEKKRAAIVELKSGKPFMPNKQGLTHKHYIQTLLYDLLVKSVYGKKQLNPTNFILYSKKADNRLCFAEVSRSHQMEAMELRNQIIALELLMCRMQAGNARPLNRLTPARCGHWKGFSKKNLEHFLKGYGGLDERERKYFHTLCGFIAREHFAAKVGRSRNGDIAGQANLWAKTLGEKRDNFEILSHLVLEDWKEEGDRPLLRFRKTQDTNPLANFRLGDICVLYPLTGNESSVLDHQIFKCSITEISTEAVVVRLRAKQHNRKIFQESERWNLEHDLFDSSFNSQYRELLAFAHAPKPRRQLLLGERPPAPPANEPVEAPADMTPNQAAIFRRMVNQGDMFLLWGPPGTGKTNMMLKHLVGYLHRHSSENVLLLTYTNRAADEICEAISSFAEGELKEAYYRIGSRYSTAADFRGRLLNHLIRDCRRREEVKAVIQSHRLVVGTLASILGRRDLFGLLRFDRVIIDEASQITEPMVCGLLPVFPKVLMIGDHKQLPAVTTQPVGDCQVHDEQLQAVGLTDLRASLFERLYLLYESKGYRYALGQLSEQGRMHRDIMRFPSERFYGNALSILPEGIPYREKQCRPSTLAGGGVLSQGRLLFVPVQAGATDDLYAKTNLAEAEKVVELAQAYSRAYEQSGRPFDWGMLGVITPFRAQIACIREHFQMAGIDPDALTIDTVERYQGGARDIVLISVCANSIPQLGSIVSRSPNAPMDRKLNVALTRAREHLVVVGNPEILRFDDDYRSLMEHIQRHRPASRMDGGLA